jgi:hypothetical protein
MRCENKPLLQDDPRFFQDITSTAVEVGLIRPSRRANAFPNLPDGESAKLEEAWQEAEHEDGTEA